jgi:ribonuclease J
MNHMTFDFSAHPDRLFFVPLGGSNEIGMNLNLYTTQGKWLMIDCGIGFTGDYLPGVEIMVPNIDFIIERKKDLLGMVITHAHEDHLGGVPYLWRDLECPIYATPFTAALLRHKIAEMGPGKKPVIHEILPGGQVQLAPFSLDFIGVTHSIPEMQAIAVKTKAGVVMHTGDWKFDDAPQVGPSSDYAALQKYGDEGVLAMVCDSTNVFVEGHSGSEEEVREHLTEVIKNCPNRVVVTTFASNVARLETVIKAAHAAGRVIALAGRSMWRMMETAHEAGYLKDETDFMDDREAMLLPRQDVLILCTGCQGEPRAALTRIANDTHPTLRLQAGDTVIMSSRKIPGNELKINYMVNMLVRKNVEVITDRNFYIHVSGHPAREELKKMYSMVKPHIAVPTHGEAQHIHEHAKLARNLGVRETIEAKNGSVVLLDKSDARVVGSVEAGYLAVDGNSLIPTNGSIIKDRRRMRDNGCVTIAFAIDRNARITSEVSMELFGLLDAKDDAELIAEYKAELIHTLERTKRASKSQLAEVADQTMRKLIKRDLDKKPTVSVHVLTSE